MSKNEYKPIILKAEQVSPSLPLIIDDNTVMHNKYLTFSCDLLSRISENFVLKIGHGKNEYAATWLEITPKSISVWHKYAETSCYLTEEHGLTLSDFIKVIIDARYGEATITVGTSNGMYRNNSVPWAGRNGKVYAETQNGTLSEVTASWWSRDYKKSIYMFGDSYFNTGSAARWPYYLHKDGYDNCFMTGYPGMGCQRGIIDAEISFKRGTPEYAVWCLGMNNGDSDSEINATWLETTTKFLDLCKTNNIIPILTTIPSTPKINNRFKTQWVKDSGVRYIDFEKAVGAHIDRSWYKEMLHTDEVHPDVLGAKALYMQVLTDFPEIMEQ